MFIIITGVGRWNHRGSIYLSIFLLLICIGFQAYDLITYIIQYWGDETQLMRLLSYSSFLITIAAVAVLCLLANLRNIVPRTRVSSFDWTLALHPRFIVQRFQYLNPETSRAIKKPFLVACMIWPLFNSSYRACIFFFVVNNDNYHYTQFPFVLLTDGIAELIWGWFCYLMILLRTSIRIQLNLDVKFLRSHLGDVDICRQRLSTSMHDYGSLCNLCAKWMILTMSMTAIGAATHTSWNYLQLSGKVAFTPVKIHVNNLIWSELLMFSVLSMTAVGGLDLHRIWVDFQIRICEVFV